MPFLADKLQHGDKMTVWQLTSGLINLLGAIMAVVGIFLMVFTEPLLNLVVGNNLSPDQMHDAVLIMRIISLNPLLFAISGILTSLQQTFGRFFFFAFGPIIYNCCIIASVYIFKDNIGIVGLGIGAVAGAILQLLFVLFGLHGLILSILVRLTGVTRSLGGFLSNCHHALLTRVSILLTPLSKPTEPVFLAPAYYFL